MKTFPQLSFPPIEPRIRTSGSATEVFDPIRGKWLRLTPEEWVRQHVVHYLVHEKGYPAGLMRLESGLDFHGQARRSDILCCDRIGRPLLLVECKGPEVAMDQRVMDQAARYNLNLKAGYIMITNGIQVYCGAVQTGRIEFLSEVPSFEKALTSS